MLPTINEFVSKYGLENFVVVADSGLMKIQIRLPLNKEVYNQTMLMARHQKIAKLFDEDFWVTQ